MPSVTKSPSFIVRSADPFCGGPDLRRLIAERITPVDSMYVRNHGGAPKVDPTSYRLVVEGMVERVLSLSLSELEDRFPRVERVATLQCAGNRRDELIAVRPIPGEVAWGAEAIGTGRWSGFRVADVLGAAGVRGAGDRGSSGGADVEPGAAAHVAFEGLDAVERRGRTFAFGASIALERAMRGDVLLADRLDGEALPPMHGYPLRVVVPGFIGARSVKWLTRITVQAGRSDNYFEARAYKLLPPDVDPADADWAAYPPIEDGPLHAVIASFVPVDSNAAESNGAVELNVTGYATGRGLEPVTSVEVAVEDERGDRSSWVSARLLDEAEPGVWVRWKASVAVPPGGSVLVARASDASGVPQPEHPRARWNPKGYSNDAWHRVPIDRSASRT